MKPEVADKIHGVNSPDKGVETRYSLAQSNQSDNSGGMLPQLGVSENSVSDE